MIKNWVIYFVTVAGLIIFAIMYIKQSAFVILMMAAVVPLLYSVITYIQAKRNVIAYISTDMLMMEKGKKTEFQVVIENSSEMNRGCAVFVYVTVNNGIGTSICRFKRKIYLTSDREVTTFEYVPVHSGINEIMVEKIKICNGFSLLHCNVEAEGSLSFLIMPEYKDFPIHPETIYDENEGESDRFSAVKPGNDPSELYDIRLYKPGDKLNRINWKFTAKNNELMVQDYGFSIACDTAVFFDISGEKDLNKVERAIEILYYLMVNYVLAKKLFYVIWKDLRADGVKRKMISGDEDIYDLLHELFQSDMGKSDASLEDIYNAQYEGEYLSGSILIYSSRKDVEDEEVRCKLRTDVLEFVHV